MHVPSLFKTATLGAQSKAGSKQAPYQRASPRNSVDVEADSGASTPRFALCNGSPALIGMFRALAKENDDYGDDDGVEEDSYESGDTGSELPTTAETSPRQS